MNKAKPEQSETPRIQPVPRMYYPPKAGWIRMVLVLGGLTLIGLLIASRMLTPDPTGIGTHRQLGLPPCGFKVLYEIPCPACGMTTSWALLTRGDVLNSLRANPGGSLLGLACLVFGPWLLISGLRAKWFVGVPDSFWLAIVFVVILFVTALHWALQIWG